MFRPYLQSCITALSLLVFAVSTNSTSHSAEAVLKAPTEFPACQLVILEAAGTKGDTIEWACSGRDIRVWVSPDKLSAVCWVPSPRQVLFVVKSKDKAGADVAYVQCEVTGDEPKPDNPMPAPAPKPDAKPDIKPEPTPTPTPTPKPLPPGRFGISKGVCEQACKIIHADRDKQASQVSESLKTVRAQIVAGGIDVSRTRDVLNAITRANSTLPAETRRNWTTWGQWWGGQIKTLHDAGKLKTANDWRDVLDETCLGLDAIK